MTIRNVRTTFVLAAASLVSFSLVGCSSDTRSSITSDVQNATNSAAESVARNIATQQGEEQFKNAQQELAGPLTCEAAVKADAANIEISCTGSTKAGGAATLVGTTSELPGASVVSLSGSFVGAVDGQEVFNTQRLGG